MAQKILYIFVSIVACLLPHCANAGDEPDVYGNIQSWDYLTGRFNPAKHRLFISLSELGIPTNNSQHFLRREAARALKEMYTAFRKDHPGAPFRVQSSTRNFFDQKQIWESKWKGWASVSEKKLNKTAGDPLKMAMEILTYSSMPGGSRHHWGTDFDLNVLSNTYYESGEGLSLYRWLVKNASQYGFCQPYTAGRKTGHEEERWHWSYYSLAKIFISEWKSSYKKYPGRFNEHGLFSGSSEAGHLAPLYMNAINQDCR